MRELRESILRQGQCVGDSIVKVDMFLNHRLDTRLMFAMGRELADYFGKDKPDIVLTVEASGIALALAAAHFLDDIPVVLSLIHIWLSGNASAGSALSASRAQSAAGESGYL